MRKALIRKTLNKQNKNQKKQSFVNVNINDTRKNKIAENLRYKNKRQKQNSCRLLDDNFDN